MAFSARQVQIPTGGLPAGYTRLDYIQSSGTQYINTGFKPTCNTRLVIDAKMGSNSGSALALFGTRNQAIQAAPDAFLIYQTGESTFRSDYFGSKQTLTLSVTTDNRLTIDMNKNVTTVGNVSVTNTAKTSGTSDYPLFLFACNSLGSATQTSTVRLYSCQIYDNGTLVRDFAPCKNPDNVYGLYDLVNKEFYANAGSGSFTGG